MALWGAPAVQAADPQSYRVDLKSTGDAAIDATLKATSELQSLRTSAPVSPFGLIGRARADVERLKTVLESFGYYQSRVTITIGGTALGDPRLGEVLTALPKGGDALVAIGFDLGPLYHLRRIDVDGDLPDLGTDALGLAAGAPAVASAVQAAGARLQNTLQERGYAFAKVDPPVAYEDASAPLLDLRFSAVAGPLVNIGDIHFEGLKLVHEKRVRARLLLRSGTRYSPAAIEAARTDLLRLGVFASIGVRVGTEVDTSGGVPITFEFHERPRYADTINAAYSSDLGGSGGVTWSDRNVFGNAEGLVLSASVIDLGGSAITGTGYDTSAKYVTPDFGHRDQTLQLTVGAIKQSLQAYDQTATTGTVTLNRKLSSIWSASVGLSAAGERIIQENTTRDYTLIAVPLGLTLDSTHLASPLDDPVHGMRASLTVTPTEAIGTPNATFIISQIKAAAYLDLGGLTHGDPGRSVLAVRALAGLAQGAGEFSLPPDQRFYGGGSATIRGYRYQAVGPQFADGNPVGGTAIIAGTVEWRQRFGANYGAAAFIDAGQVSASLKPLPSVLRVGMGAGLRYYTPIGPIRFDVALPTQHYSNDDDGFELYIGLGQAF